MPNKIKMTKSSGNVFADLGVKNVDERLAKAKLAFTINQIIAKRKLTQVAAGKILKINQPKISALANGRLAGFSIERLIDFLNKLDQDVEIIIHEKPKNRRTAGKFSVAVVH
jgi:predicted XRE-type DNA-binding protein